MQRHPFLRTVEILVWIGFGFGLVAPLFTSGDESAQSQLFSSEKTDMLQKR